MQHTKCGVEGLDGDELSAEIEHELGQAPPFRFGGFDDVRASVRDSIQTLTESPFLPQLGEARGFVYDVDTGLLTEVD